MKTPLTFLLILVCTHLNAQSGVTGHYQDYFGGALNIDADSTFKYSWSFDLMASWTKGKWTKTKDTLFFIMIPVYDTVRQTLKNGEVVDSLVLSRDEIPERITLDPNVLYSGGQNIRPFPTKLLYKKKRLYEIDKNGKPYKKWRRGVWSTHKWPLWFKKTAG